MNHSETDLVLTRENAENIAVETATNDTVQENTENTINTTVETSANAPYGRMKGEFITSLPSDLYIPPDAMEVILEIFEGPLDLLLYLIKKHNLDILNIPVAEITRQYMEYVELMSVFQLTLAADYLEMAAFLAEIKSRMLLPRPVLEGLEEEDPRAELVRRLQEYERFKLAAEGLENLPRLGRELFPVSSSATDLEILKQHPEVDLKEVLLAFKEVLMRADLQTAHTIQREVLSVRERMSRVLSQLQGDKFVEFVNFFDVSEGRLGVVVTFLAILELLKEMLVELVQHEPFGTIYIRSVGSEAL